MAYDEIWLPTGNFTSGGNSMEYIVVHNTGNTASAAQEANYAHNDSHSSSYHYVLDGTDIYQIVHEYDTAWSVGAWPGCTAYIRNNQSINIEVCSNGDPFTDSEIEQLHWLVRDIMDRHGIDAGHVVRHWDCMSGRKDCPAAYIDAGAWANLRAIITAPYTPPAPPVIPPHQEPGDPVNNAGFNYQAHVQDIGWCDCVRDGMVAGTVGFSKRLEALRFGPPAGLVIGCKVHIEDTGWVDFPDINGDTIIGTVGESKRIECILPYVKSNTTGLTPYFCCHVQDIGWEGKTAFGFAEGSTGECRRIEAVKFWME